MEADNLLNKKCKLVLNNGFILYGLVKGVDQYGITFETKQKTSYQSFLNIRELTPLDEGL